MKHTPGLWELVVNPAYPTLVSIEMSNGKDVGYLAAMSEPEEMANARLISAAPDLLIALKMLLNSNLINKGDHEWTTCNQPSCIIARTALNKAEPNL